MARTCTTCHHYDPTPVALWGCPPAATDWACEVGIPDSETDWPEGAPDCPGHELPAEETPR